MANNLTVLFRHQADCQSPRSPQGIDNGSLGPAAMWSTVERSGDERADFFNILRFFWSYNHENCVAHERRIAKTQPSGPDADSGLEAADRCTVAVRQQWGRERTRSS